MKPQTPKLQEEHIVSSVHETGVGKDFLGRTPLAQDLRPTIDKWDIVTKKLSTAKNQPGLRGGGGHRMEGNLPAMHLMEN